MTSTDRMAVMLAALALVGCSEYGTRAYGVQRGAQDQTRVATPPPLSLPPVLAERVMRSDAPSRSAAADTAPGTIRALSRPGPRARSATGRPQSSGEASLLDASGPSAPGDIRDKVDQDAQIGRADRGYADRLLFAPSGPQVAGRDPIIQRGGGLWFDGLF